MVATADEMTAGESTLPVGDRSRTVVAGHYEVDLDAPLGTGGMALVYQGRDLRTRRIVAIKTLRPEYRGDPDSRARFRREVRTLAFLHHPNVARVYDLQEGDETPWAIMEFVPGRSLKAEVAAEGSLDLDTTAHILNQIAAALGHLHRRGYVHLDVKPQNLIITPERTVKLIDFGLCQRPGEPQEIIDGRAFGTAAYLAPEQACGEEISPATDIYALGCVVYELLTGRPPFVGTEDKNEIIRAHVDQTPISPTKVNPRLPAWIDQVVPRALAKQPKDRYRDVEDFADLFREGIERGVVSTYAADDRAATAHVTNSSRTIGPVERPIAGGDVVRAAYRAGGRRLRRAEALRTRLWRIVAALAITNVLLALVLLAGQGSLPGLSGSSTLHAGATARVTVDNLNVRSEAGLGAETVGQIDAGERLDVTGDSRRVDERVWWPVRFRHEGDTVEGYVAAEGIEPVASDGITGFPGRIWDAVTP